MAHTRQPRPDYGLQVKALKLFPLRSEAVIHKCFSNMRVTNRPPQEKLGRSQDVCKGARFSVEGERCVVSRRSPFKRLKVNEEERGETIRDFSPKVADVW